MSTSPSLSVGTTAFAAFVRLRTLRRSALFFSINFSLLLTGDSLARNSSVVRSSASNSMGNLTWR